jgi:hypothetical protein
VGLWEASLCSQSIEATSFLRRFLATAKMKNAKKSTTQQQYNQTYISNHLPFL